MKKCMLKNAVCLVLLALSVHGMADTLWDSLAAPLSKPVVVKKAQEYETGFPASASAQLWLSSTFTGKDALLWLQHYTAGGKTINGLEFVTTMMHPQVLSDELVKQATKVSPRLMVFGKYTQFDSRTNWDFLNTYSGVLGVKDAQDRVYTTVARYGQRVGLKLDDEPELQAVREGITFAGKQTSMRDYAVTGSQAGGFGRLLLDRNTKVANLYYRIEKIESSDALAVGQSVGAAQNGVAFVFGKRTSPEVLAAITVGVSHASDLPKNVILSGEGTFASQRKGYDSLLLTMAKKEKGAFAATINWPIGISAANSGLLRNARLTYVAGSGNVNIGLWDHLVEIGNMGNVLIQSNNPQMDVLHQLRKTKGVYAYWQNKTGSFVLLAKDKPTLLADERFDLKDKMQAQSKVLNAQANVISAFSRLQPGEAIGIDRPLSLTESAEMDQMPGDFAVTGDAQQTNIYRMQ